jgi:F-type H+-transporting ATPase subunit epsilon
MESSQPIRLRIVTPEKIIYNEMVNHVILPAVKGEMGIFHKHVPFMSYLKPGHLTIHLQDQKVIHFTINSGLLEFKDDAITILTTEGISVSDHCNDVLAQHNDEQHKEN